MGKLSIDLYLDNMIKRYKSANGPRGVMEQSKNGTKASVPMRKFHHLMTFASQKLDEKTIYQDTDISKDRYQQFYSS